MSPIVVHLEQKESFLKTLVKKGDAFMHAKEAFEFPLCYGKVHIKGASERGGNFDVGKLTLSSKDRFHIPFKLQPSVRTRRTSEPIDDATFDGVLKCFSNINSVKSITKKISIEVAQLLLAHGFQVIVLVGK